MIANIAYNALAAVATLMIFGVSPVTIAGITICLWTAYMVENWSLGR